MKRGHWSLKTFKGRKKFEKTSQLQTLFMKKSMIQRVEPRAEGESQESRSIVLERNTRHKEPVLCTQLNSKTAIYQVTAMWLPPIFSFLNHGIYRSYPYHAPPLHSGHVEGRRLVYFSHKSSSGEEPYSRS